MRGGRRSPWWFRAWPVVAGVLLAAMPITGCFDGELGAECSGESGCSFGLRCFQPEGFSSGICTVRCGSGCPDDGSCITTAQGELCAAACSEPGECPSGQLCQTARGLDGAVCYPEDPNLTPIPGETPDPEGPGRVEVAGTLVTDDDNEDGALSGGETARIHVFVQNPGENALVGVWAAATAIADPMTPHFELDRCWSSSRYCQSATDGICSCADDAYFSLGAGEVVDDAAIIELEVEIAPNATDPVVIDLEFGDDAGGQWFDRVELPVVAAGARVTASRYEIVDEQNDDGLISPGETVEIEVFAANNGVTTALSVWGEGSATDELDVSRCWGTSGYCQSTTDGVCSCEPSGSGIDIESGFEAGVVRFEATVDPATVPGVHELPVRFGDRLGNTWSDTVSIDIAANPADIAIARDEVSTTSSDQVQVYAVNNGTSEAIAVYADVRVTGGGASVTRCWSPNGYCQSATGGVCSCANSGSTHIAANETTAGPILRFELDTTGVTVTYEVTFTDDWGNQWTDTSTIEVP